MCPCFKDGGPHSVVSMPFSGFRLTKDIRERKLYFPSAFGMLYLFSHLKLYYTMSVKHFHFFLRQSAITESVFFVCCFCFFKGT